MHTNNLPGLLRESGTAQTRIRDTESRVPLSNALTLTAPPRGGLKTQHLKMGDQKNEIPENAG